MSVRLPDDASVRLCWRTINYADDEIPAAAIEQGSSMHMILNYPMQYAFVNSCCPRFVTSEGANVWLQMQDQRFFAGECQFTQHVAFVLRHKGLMANLTMRENLMLPFACETDQDRLAKARDMLPQVAEFLGLEQQLDRQAGERSPCIHALVSLGHCMLKEALFVVIQEMDFGFSGGYWQQFQEKLLHVVRTLKPGLLYLSASSESPPSLEFQHRRVIEGGTEDGVSGIW